MDSMDGRAVFNTSRRCRLRCWAFNRKPIRTRFTIFSASTFFLASKQVFWRVMSHTTGSQLLAGSLIHVDPSIQKCAVHFRSPSVLKVEIRYAIPVLSLPIRFDRNRTGLFVSIYFDRIKWHFCIGGSVCTHSGAAPLYPACVLPSSRVA